jgi:hypothetical protein
MSTHIYNQPKDYLMTDKFQNTNEDDALVSAFLDQLNAPTDNTRVAQNMSLPSQSKDDIDYTQAVEALRGADQYFNEIAWQAKQPISILDSSSKKRIGEYNRMIAAMPQEDLTNDVIDELLINNRVAGVPFNYRANPEGDWAPKDSTGDIRFGYGAARAGWSFDTMKKVVATKDPKRLKNLAAGFKFYNLSSEYLEDDNGFVYQRGFTEPVLREAVEWGKKETGFEKPLIAPVDNTKVDPYLKPPANREYAPQLLDLMKSAESELRNISILKQSRGAEGIVGGVLSAVDRWRGGKIGRSGLIQVLGNLTDAEIDSVLEADEIYELEQNWGPYLDFYNRVKTGGKWDIKNSENYKRSGYPLLGITIAGQPYSFDVPGNVLYGYAGASAGFSPGLLRKMAGLAQLNHDKGEKGSSSRPINAYFDDPRDQAQISAGIVLYELSKTRQLTPRILQRVLDDFGVD